MLMLSGVSEIDIKWRLSSLKRVINTVAKEKGFELVVRKGGETDGETVKALAELQDITEFVVEETEETDADKEIIYVSIKRSWLLAWGGLQPAEAVGFRF